MSLSEWGHCAREPFLHREQCMSLEANRITSAKWAAAVSQLQALLVTSDVQLDSKHGIWSSKEVKKYSKKVVPLGIQTFVELDPKVSTPVLCFHQKYQLLQSGKDYFSCLGYNLALNTKTIHIAGNLRCANNRCSPCQEANSIWLVSEIRRIEIQYVYSCMFETTCEILT